jgi:uncharacterized protein (TIGR00730 family)
MHEISSVAVFCGSRLGNNPAYASAARELGTGLASAGIRLVFGGGKIGLMGAIADAVLEGGGTVLGVIPDFLRKWEVAHPTVTEMVVTDTMHSRKTRMAQEADAFVTFPGGLGTLDETVEIVTWRQLRLHDKPIFICDVAGSAEPFVSAIDGLIAQGFAPVESRSLFTVVHGVTELLDHLGREPRGTGVAAARL